MIRAQTYFLILVNDIIKDYTLDKEDSKKLAQFYRQNNGWTTTVQVLEIKSVEITDF